VQVGSSLEGVLSSEFFSSSSLLERMGQYEAMDATEGLRKHLVDLERAASHRDHAREVRQAKKQYKILNKASRKRLVEERGKERQQWLQFASETAKKKDAPALELLDELQDDLEGEMHTVLAQMYAASSSIAKLQNELKTRSGGTGTGEPGSLQAKLSVQQTALQQLEAQRVTAFVRCYSHHSSNYESSVHLLINGVLLFRRRQ